jgi:osomolarity two-component system sensor histidine kinase TcsA
MTDISAIHQLTVTELEDKFNYKVLNLFMHEFKTPLNWLNGVLSSIIPSDTTQNLLKMAKHATNILNLYIDDIAFYNSNQLNKFKTLSKNFSIQNCVNECTAFIASDIEISKISCQQVISKDLPTSLYGDPIRYKQILNNILSNSVKSCKSEDGIIQIKVELIQNYIYTTVTDNGPLLSKDEINILINPLNQHEMLNLQIRFGIGMILCRDMCRRCGGDLNIYTNEQCNVYKFWIPYKPPLPDADQESITMKKVHIHSLRKQVSTLPNVECKYKMSAKPILVVDDTPFNNYMLVHMLKLLNVECVACNNGKEAVEQYLECSVKYSLILMDINMPVMDGIEVIALNRRPRGLSVQ